MARDHSDIHEPVTGSEDVIVTDAADSERNTDDQNGAPGWFISIGVHCLFGLLFYCADRKSVV